MKDDQQAVNQAVHDDAWAMKVVTKHKNNVGMATHQ
jgi:hypothetical protein